MVSIIYALHFTRITSIFKYKMKGRIFPYHSYLFAWKNPYYLFILGYWHFIIVFLLNCQ